MLTTKEGESDPPAQATKAFDRSLVTGIAWTGGIKSFSQALSWIATLVIAHLLTLGDYGIANMAVTYFGLVELVSEFGLGAAVVQKRTLSSDQIAKLGGLSVAFGAVSALLSLLLAEPIARFFGEPALRAVIMVMSSTCLISGFQVLPRSLLTRDLGFAPLARIEGLEAITLTLVTITLAVLRFGYWSFVWGAVISRAIGTIALLSSYPHRLAWPRPLRSVAEPVSFGGHILMASLAWYAYRSADMAIVGKTLGKSALGAYSVGFNLASIPVERIAGLLSRATPAILSAVQTDAHALRRYFLGITEGLAMVTMPVAVGLALVASEFVGVALGQKWEPAVGPLRLLALAAVFRSVFPLMSSVLVATGQARRNFQATVAIAMILPPLFLFGSTRGISGVAAVWLVAYPLVVAAFLMRFAWSASATTGSQYLRAVWPAASAVLAMSAMVLLLTYLLPRDLPLVVRLVAKAGVGALTYSAVLYWGYRDRVMVFFRLFQSTLRR